MLHIIQVEGMGFIEFDSRQLQEHFDLLSTIPQDDIVSDVDATREVFELQSSSVQDTDSM